MASPADSARPHVCPQSDHVATCSNCARHAEFAEAMFRKNMELEWQRQIDALMADCDPRIVA